jgi:hypothetical protein
LSPLFADKFPGQGLDGENIARVVAGGRHFILGSFCSGRSASGKLGFEPQAKGRRRDFFSGLEPNQNYSYSFSKNSHAEQEM